MGSFSKSIQEDTLRIFTIKILTWRNDSDFALKNSFNSTSIFG